VCSNTLKGVRQKIADANGIEYTPSVCNHQSDSVGTCPACEAEVRYLEQELEKKRLAGEPVNITGVAEFSKDKHFVDKLHTRIVVVEEKIAESMGRPYEKILRGKIDTASPKNCFQHMLRKLENKIFADDGL